MHPRQKWVSAGLVGCVTLSPAHTGWAGGITPPGGQEDKHELLRSPRICARTCAQILPACSAETGRADQGSQKCSMTAAQSASDKLHQLGTGCLSHLLTHQPAFQAGGCVRSDGSEGAGALTVRRAPAASSPRPGTRFHQYAAWQRGLSAL